MARSAAVTGGGAEAAGVASQRLRNQRIASPHRTPLEVVSSLGAVQAQDYPGALWAVGLRTSNASERDVERALASRVILRTWPMRGTLHFVAAADVRWMLDLLAPRVIAATAPRNRQLGLDAADFARSRKIVVAALEGDRQVSRPDLYARLDAAGISTAAGRGLHIVLRLALEGLICFGARDGTHQTFALLAEWAPHAVRMERDESLAELARRYFTGHGPASWRDFAWWSGLRAADARRAIDLAGPHLVEDTGGGPMWRGRSAPRASADRLAATYLLPPFDEYTVAYKDRTAVLHARDAPHAQAGGVFSPTIVINGRVAGTWTRRVSRDGLVITPMFFPRRGGGDRRLLEAAVARYGRFRDRPARLG